MFDLMGFPPCHRNKINIHVGGIYGDKEHTIRRFAENFNTRLSPNLQARLTVENDDRPNSYSMTDLLLLHHLTSIPLVSVRLHISTLKMGCLNLIVLRVPARQTARATGMYQCMCACLPVPS